MTRKIPIKVAFIGAASVGKDTTIFNVAGYLKLNKYNVDVLPESAREALYRGFKLDRKSTLGTALYIVGRQLQSEALYMENGLADVVLCNRCILDGIVYGKYSLPPSAYKKYCEGVLAFLPLCNYDLILVLEPFRAIIDDGIRDTDKTYNEKTLKDFRLLADSLKNMGENVVTISDAQMGLRVPKIYNCIESFLKLRKS